MATPQPAATPVLLVADPDQDTGSELLLALSQHGVSVIVCTDGADALLRVGLDRPDVILVGAGLPTVEATAFIRAVKAKLPITLIVGVGPADADATVRALAAGANFCVPRPYRPAELLPLITGRVTEPAAEPVLTCGPVELDHGRHLVRVDARPVHLPQREYELLHYLMRGCGKVITRTAIQTDVWRTDRILTNTIAVHIRRLRERLGDDPENPALIVTVRGIGYRLACP
ncbi:response regulator transcription factor [Actinocorallia sp. API 0066]|uniref:response regulator transcription factor n=1 Tax=Actinocorallia sp. API 0066 TaxID=2896846 RepID=UPI001E453649|nr:response regulator transcription factor [Actinocorallia sp. API 0066]MCD0449380.1 response regulator transcription factor [Actinocorallia sp. API 0066]